MECGAVTECSKCGDCCRVIPVNATKKRFAEKAAAGETGSSPFILQHWHRISREEARRRNPHFGGATPGHYYYECDMFDPVKNECMAHDSRPQVCRGFPWYGDSPADRLYRIGPFPRCSFWADVPAAERPAYVQMGETRKAS